MNYVIYGFLLILLHNISLLITQKKFIINIDLIRNLSFFTHIVIFIILYILNFSHLAIFIKNIGFMHLLFIYFSFLFFYQLCALIKIISANKLDYNFMNSKNEIVTDSSDFIRLVLFSSVFFPIFELEYINQDLTNILLVVALYFVMSIIEVKANITNAKTSIVIKNTLRCFFSLVVHQACQNIFIVILFIGLTKIFDYYKFAERNIMKRRGKI